MKDPEEKTFHSDYVHLFDVVALESRPTYDTE